jgi:ankyrin repeat protein
VTARPQLHDIVQSGSTAALDTFLNNNSPGDDALADALVAAVTCGKVEMVQALLAKGADPNRPSGEAGWDAMHVAVEHEMDAVIPVLVSAGAKLNGCDGSGMTPLHLAVDIEADGAHQSGEEPTARLTALLLGLGADPEAPDIRGRTVLSLAEDYEHEAAITAIRRHIRE